jgi:hypothetical protein
MPDGQRRGITISRIFLPAMYKPMIRLSGIRSFLIKAMKQVASDHTKLHEERILAIKIDAALAEVRLHIRLHYRTFSLTKWHTRL